ncbi:MAG: AI-2E family transporter [Candidatus Kapabacteria bacterium]|nr:AI-2E family transporter [Candidatus Kapabacteria bacterium]
MDTSTPWQRAASISTSLLAIIAVGIVLHELSGILIPFVLAGFLSILFKPLVQKLRDIHVPLPIALILVLIISAGALWFVYLIIALGVDSFNEKSVFYGYQLKAVLADVERTVGGLLKSFGSKTTFRFEKVLTPETAAAFATGQVSNFLAILSDGVMVLLYLLFMLGSSGAFPNKIRSAFSRLRGGQVLTVFESLNMRVRKYLVLKTLFNLANGVIAWLILTAFGVDFAPFFGLLTFLFHFIPNIGSLISTVIPTFVCLLQTGSITTATAVAVILVVVQNVIGNVIEPKVMGDRLELSPVVVLFALLFWGWMWGIVGMILSIPIMSFCKALLETIPSTRPIAVLLGSTPTAPVPVPEETIQT